MVRYTLAWKAKRLSRRARVSSQYHRRRQVREKKKTTDVIVDKLSLSKKRLSSSLTEEKDNSRWNLMKSNL